MVKVVTFPIHPCSKDIGGSPEGARYTCPMSGLLSAQGIKGWLECVSLLVVIGDEGSLDDSHLVPFFLV